MDQAEQQISGGPLPAMNEDRRTTIDQTESTIARSQRSLAEIQALLTRLAELRYPRSSTQQARHATR
jgi:hypothetical protein